jgi:hypothetical protein
VRGSRFARQTALLCLEHVALPASSFKDTSRGTARPREVAPLDQGWDEFSPLELITARMTRTASLASVDRERCPAAGARLIQPLTPPPPPP